MHGRSCDIVCDLKYMLTYACVQDKCLMLYHGGIKGTKALLGMQSHNVPVLHNGDMVFCL